MQTTKGTFDWKETVKRLNWTVNANKRKKRWKMEAYYMFSSRSHPTRHGMWPCVYRARSGMQYARICIAKRSNAYCVRVVHKGSDGWNDCSEYHIKTSGIKGVSVCVLVITEQRVVTFFCLLRFAALLLLNALRNTISLSLSLSRFDCLRKAKRISFWWQQTIYSILFFACSIRLKNIKPSRKCSAE